MKKCMLLFIVIALTISVSGCASIVSGRRQSINFRSFPDNATVEVYNSYGANVASATTPAAIVFKRSRGYFRRANFTVQISKDGYETQTINIRGGLNGWHLAGNIPFFIFAPVGWLIVDPLTGAMWTLRPQSVNTTLRQTFSFDDSGDEDVIHIVLKEQIPEDLFASLDLVQIR